jgi:hypothetical protein
MFQRIHTYHRIVGADGASYFPRAYGDPQPNGSWSGYLAFFPRVGSVVSTDRQTTEPTLSLLKDWANELSIDDLQAALTRARELSRDSLVADEIARLRFLETEAQLDAEALEEEADRDASAAAEARAEAEQLKRERTAFERDAALSEENTRRR